MCRLLQLQVKIQSGPLWSGVAYGWNAAIDLAKQIRPQKESAMNNADSLALFASGETYRGPKLRRLADPQGHRREAAR